MTEPTAIAVHGLSLAVSGPPRALGVRQGQSGAAE